MRMTRIRSRIRISFREGRLSGKVENRTQPNKISEGNQTIEIYGLNRCVKSTFSPSL